MIPSRSLRLCAPGACLFAFAALASYAGALEQTAAGTPRTPAPDRAHIIEVARSVISAARYCTLVTIGASGGAEARIMDPLAPSEDLSIDFATNPRSRKTREIRKDARVTLLYFDSTRPAYVTVIGRAHEVGGAQKKSRHKQEWQAFFPAERPDSYTLFRLVPERIEVVSVADGLSGDLATWRPDTVILK